MYPTGLIKNVTKMSTAANVNLFSIKFYQRKGEMITYLHVFYAINLVVHLIFHAQKIFLQQEDVTHNSISTTENCTYL